MDAESEGTGGPTAGTAEGDGGGKDACTGQERKHHCLLAGAPEGVWKRKYHVESPGD